MKVSVKGVAITLGIFWAVCMFWAVLMQIVGVGSIPFDFADQFYLGWLSPTILGGLVLGTVLAFIDGMIVGAICAWIYNKLA